MFPSWEQLKIQNYMKILGQNIQDFQLEKLDAQYEETKEDDDERGILAENKYNDERGVLADNIEVTAENIEFVVFHTKCQRDVTIDLLKKCGNNVVEAILLFQQN